jgi:hypothetical protein
MTSTRSTQSPSPRRGTISRPCSTSSGSGRWPRSTTRTPRSTASRRSYHYGDGDQRATLSTSPASTPTCPSHPTGHTTCRSSVSMLSFSDADAGTPRLHYLGELRLSRCDENQHCAPFAVRDGGRRDRFRGSGSASPGNGGVRKSCAGSKRTRK